MLELNQVTLVAVTSVRVKQALWALKHSSKHIRFHSVKLLTDVEIKDKAVEVIKIPRLDYDGYSKFLIYELYKYIETPYMLLVQDDGYVVHPEAWSDDFLNYDYIGAPWAFPHDDFSYRDQQGNIRRVGNGGFSLRSRKLMKLADDLKLPWEPYHGFYHEDGYICTQNVLVYEEKGLKIAPLEVAARFAMEVELPEHHGVKPFGFHGKESKYNLQYNSLPGQLKAFVSRMRRKWRKKNGL